MLDNSSTHKTPPFIGHKTADQILDSLAPYCRRISDSDDYVDVEMCPHRAVDQVQEAAKLLGAMARRGARDSRPARRI